MMRPLIMQVALFRNHAEDPTEHERSRLSMLYFLEALVNHDRLWLRQYPDTPDIYDSGVKYKHKDEIEAPAWQDIASCIGKKYGDCKDFAAWRVAELRERYGVDCHPVIVWRKVGEAYRFHALVEFADGSTEDPSVALGMPQIQIDISGSTNNMDAAKVAKAIIRGLLSKDDETKRKAKASFKKIEQLAGDDPDCAQALAMTRHGCAVLRRKLQSKEDVVGAAGVIPGRGIGSSSSPSYSPGFTASGPTYRPSFSSGPSYAPSGSGGGYAGLVTNAFTASGVGARRQGIVTNMQQVTAQQQAVAQQQAALAAQPYSPYPDPSSYSASPVPFDSGGGYMAPYEDDDSGLDDYSAFMDSEEQYLESNGDSDSEMMGDAAADQKQQQDTANKVADVMQETSPLASALISLIPVVGPALAPIANQDIQEGANMIHKANGGDQKALNTLKATKTAAQRGDPQAQDDMDVLTRVYKVVKAVNSTFKPKPFKWSFKNVYRAGIEGEIAMFAGAVPSK